MGNVCAIESTVPTHGCWKNSWLHKWLASDRLSFNFCITKADVIRNRLLICFCLFLWICSQEPTVIIQNEDALQLDRAAYEYSQDDHLMDTHILSRFAMQVTYRILIFVLDIHFNPWILNITKASFVQEWLWKRFLKLIGFLNHIIISTHTIFNSTVKDLTRNALHSEMRWRTFLLLPPDIISFRHKWYYQDF